MVDITLTVIAIAIALVGGWAVYNSATTSTRH